MWSLRRVLLAILLAVTVVAGVTACGGDDQPAPQGVPLPKDFPTQQVPLVDGVVQSASKIDDVWEVKVQVPATESNAFDKASTELTDAGYQESSRTETTREKSVLFSKEADGATYWVTLGISAAAQGRGNLIMYSVTRL